MRFALVLLLCCACVLPARAQNLRLRQLFGGDWRFSQHTPAVFKVKSILHPGENTIAAGVVDNGRQAASIKAWH
jgi:hypothetical protein